MEGAAKTLRRIVNALLSILYALYLKKKLPAVINLPSTDIYSLFFPKIRANECIDSDQEIQI